MRQTTFFLATIVAIALTGCTVRGYEPEDAFEPDSGALDAATNDDTAIDAPRGDAGPARDVGLACETQDLHSDVGTAVTMGTTLGATDTVGPICGGTGVPDALFTWTAPSSGLWAFDTIGSDFDTVLQIQRNCTFGILDCNDDFGFDVTSRVAVMLTAGERVIVVIDGYTTGHFVLGIHSVPPEICDNLIDDDGDGDADCADSDCAGMPACVETGRCADGIDNDNDFDTDCWDSDCASDPVCDESMHCSDRIDNDHDFDVDCLDSDCSSQAICLETGANCADGIDNDLDGHIDCADSDCASLTTCSESMNCGDYLDNDADDLVDCADSDCATNALCTTTESDCNNGLDDDRDGLVDCADANCAAHCAENTVALCMNTTDDDADGLIDCADLQCSCSTACPPAVAPSTTCPDQDLAMMVGDAVFQSTVVGYACGARADASCGGPTHGAGAEVELAWTAPANGMYVFDTEDSGHAGGVFDTILTLRTQCAGGAAAEFGCDDDGGTGRLSRVSHYFVAGQSTLIVIDAKNVWDGGNVTLNIHAM